MGKVGSSTIYNSLVKRGLGDRTFHLHSLSNKIEEHKKFSRQHRIFPYQEHLYFGMAIRNYIEKKSFPEINVITLVRDPVSLIISNLFQNSYQVNHLKNGDEKLVSARVIRYLNEEVVKDEIFRYFDNWFDDEMKDVFDLDVMKQPFDREKGLQTYDFDGGRLLLMRCEEISEKAPAAVSEFLKLDQHLELSGQNIRTKTSDSELYREVISKINIDGASCDRIYNRPISSHFYSEQMISSFKSRWSK